MNIANFAASIPASFEYHLARARAHVLNGIARYRHREAAAFYTELSSGGYDPNVLIDALVEPKLIYVCVPKCASTSIKMIMSMLLGRTVASLDLFHKRKYSGLRSPFQIGLPAFHKLATDAATLRFSFVRNPYERLVSAWADKFQDRYLVAGDPFIDGYLVHREAFGLALPCGEHQTLSFADFVTYATATASLRVDAHWGLQDDILSMPCLALNYIGRVETFGRDIVRILDHVSADQRLRQAAGMPLRASLHHSWPVYYTHDLADRVYRVYERDFDRFGYTRAISFARNESACA